MRKQIVSVYQRHTDVRDSTYQVIKAILLQNTQVFVHIADMQTRQDQQMLTEAFSQTGSHLSPPGRSSAMIGMGLYWTAKRVYQLQ